MDFSALDWIKDAALYLWHNKAWLFTWYLIGLVINSISSLDYKAMMLLKKIDRLGEYLPEMKNDIIDKVDRIRN